MSISIKADFGGQLIKKLENLDPNSPRFKQALFLIGSEIRNKAIKNVTDQQIVDTGKLRASIRFDIRTAKNLALLNVGVFGIPYARIMEYGGPFTDEMRRAMFARFREEGRLDPNKGPKIVNGQPVISNGMLRARPYMRPAIADSEDFIEKTMEDLIK